MTPPTPAPEPKLSILFVDDEEKTRKFFCRLYSDQFEIVQAADPSEAIQILESKQYAFAVVVTDQRMPGSTGIDLLKHMVVHYPRVVRIMSTAHSDYDVVVEAINSANVFSYVTKPWEVTELEQLLHRATEYYHLGNQNDGLLRVPEPKVIESHRIDVDDNDLGDVMLMLNLLQKAAKAAAQGPLRRSIKFTLVNRNDELVVGVNIQGKPQQLVSLAHFREQFDRLGEDASEGDLIGSLMGNLLGPGTSLPTTLPSRSSAIVLPTPPPPAPPSPAVVPAEPEVAYVSASQAISIQAAADLLQVHFSTLVNASRYRRLIKSDVAQVDAIITSLRRMRESERLVLEEAKKVKMLVANFLDDINRGRTAFRNVIVSGKIPESTFTGLFIQYSNLAHHFSGASIQPDPILTTLLLEAKDKPNSHAMRIAALAILGVPTLLALAMFSERLAVGMDGMKLLKFCFIWLLSIASAALGYHFIGKAEATATMAIPGIKGSKLSVAGTGGIAIMIFVLLLGVGVTFF